MKKTLAKTMRSVLALLLVSCLLFGMCGTVLAAEAAGEDCCINDKLDALYAELVDLMLEHGPKVVSESLGVFKDLMDAAQKLIDALEENGVTCTKLKNAVADVAKKVANSASKEDVEKALNKVKDAVNELGEEIKGNEKLVALYEDLKAKIDHAIALIILAYENATSTDYKATKDSYYVAIGDGTAVSDSYVDLVAEELKINYKNLSKDGLLVEDALAVVEKNAALIEKADLITVGFGNNTFVKDLLLEVVNYKSLDLNWEAFVGEDGEEAVEKVLDKLQAVFAEAGLDVNVDGGVNVAEALTVAVAAYTYNCLSYVVNLPCLLDKISDINPDATVVIVSMYNPLREVAFQVGDKTVSVAPFVEGLVEATGLYSLAYAMMHKNVIFVEAEDVEIAYDGDAMGVGDLAIAYMVGDMNPSEEGHEYIKDQIIDALSAKPRGLWGDANGDGYVLANDAMLVLQYSVKDIGPGDLNLDVCDVNGDGHVLANDAMLILEYSVKMITKFPVE